VRPRGVAGEKIEQKSLPHMSWHGDLIPELRLKTVKGENLGSYFD
jgi:hypothetical protein